MAVRPPETRQPSAAAQDPRSLLGIYRPDLAHLLEELQAPSYRHAQVLEHLLRHPDTPFSEASSLPNDLRTRLAGLGESVLKVVAQATAVDGTTKLLLAARDGAQVESVLIPSRQRLTICVSSQVGCPVGCLFCATGALGLRRNLTVGEIVDQVRLAAAAAQQRGVRISNVVYMGMGEPLLNLQAVVGSIRLLTYKRGIGLGHRALSVSTVGIPSGIRKLARLEPQVNLALSLHAATDEKRARLIPPAFRHGVAEVMAAAREHFTVTRRKLLVEYVLLQGINDTPQDARQLAALLKGLPVTVNLITWNPVPSKHLERARQASNARPSAASGPAGLSTRSASPAKEDTQEMQGRTHAQDARGLKDANGAQDAPGAQDALRTGGAFGLTARAHFLPSPPATARAFRDNLRAFHIETVIRQSKGADILAACGQLAADSASYRTTGPS